MGTMEEMTAVQQSQEEQYFDVVREAAVDGDMLSAKRRLAQLYHSGEGVEKDDSEAVRWYSLAALQAMNIFYKTPTLKTADAAFNILHELGELHREMEDIPHAIGSFERIETMLSALPDELLDIQTGRWEQIVCNKLGSLHERTGSTDKAYAYFSRALEKAREISRTDGSPLARDDLAVACYRVGFMEFLFDGRRELLLQAQSLWDALYDETGNYDYRSKRCVIDTLFATAEPSAGTAPKSETAAPAPAEEAQIAPNDEALPDSLAAELNEYIRQNGYSKSGAFDNFRLIFEIISIIAAVGVCLWAYFSGALFELFKWLR